MLLKDCFGRAVDIPDYSNHSQARIPGYVVAQLDNSFYIAFVEKALNLWNYTYYTGDIEIDLSKKIPVFTLAEAVEFLKDRLGTKDLDFIWADDERPTIPVPKRYTSKCNLCNSPADQLLFSYYCSNISCRNYKD